MVRQTYKSLPAQTALEHSLKKRGDKAVCQKCGKVFDLRWAMTNWLPWDCKVKMTHDLEAQLTSTSFKCKRCNCWFTQAYITLFPDEECPGPVQTKLKLDRVCECGSAKLGIKPFSPGHSTWCPVYK